MELRDTTVQKMIDYFRSTPEVKLWVSLTQDVSAHNERMKDTLRAREERGGGTE